MAYEIQAWLADDGAPGLRLIDAQSGHTRLSWQADGRCPAELKSLFQELLLLSAGRAIDTGRSQASEGHCGDPHPTQHARERTDAKYIVDATSPEQRLCGYRTSS